MPIVRREPAVLFWLVVAALGLSGISPADRFTWWLEVSTVLAGLALLGATYRGFPFTDLAYRLILVQALVILAGAHWTYARVPAGDWVRDALGLVRNPWDRLGHLLQGFVPAIIAREVVLRRSPLRPGKWLFFFVVASCLAISAFWELLEWWSAVAFGSKADDFLGTQGDPWDAHWDMLAALCGATLALITLGRVHDRQLTRLLGASGTEGRAAAGPSKPG